jgi:hypothetical protein
VQGWLKLYLFQSFLRLKKKIFKIFPNSKAVN